MPDAHIRTVTADDPPGVAAACELFNEYAEWLRPIVVHTTIDSELESLPAPFVEPGGRLLLASDRSGRICGCVAVKQHTGDACEIKRLFVREECRGGGLGRELFAAALDAACELGYTEALVTTIPSYMPRALGMYERLGFAPTAPFEDHTHTTVELVYLRLELGEWCP